MSKHVFIIGITGYIGGSVFTSLKAAHPDFTYTALVRNQSHFPAIVAAGATLIHGTFKDREIIAHHASGADIIINCGDADDVGLNEAILDGTRKRKEQGNSVAISIHTSGTALFSDGSKEGRFVEGITKAWNDGIVEDIKAITVDMPHGQVDVPIMQADLAGDVRSYIIAPSAVHGPGTGPVGKTSVFVRLIAEAYVNARKAFVIGEGTNVFGYVHIDDLVSLYLLVFNHALSFYPSPPPTSPYERYFIGNTRHVSRKTTAALFANVLYELGKIASPEVATLTFEEAGPLALAFSSNSYTIEERGSALGWLRWGASVEETLEDDISSLYPRK